MDATYRLKFKLGNVLTLPEPRDLVISDLLDHGVIAGDAPKGSHSSQWLTIKGTGFKTVADATCAARRMKDALLVVGAKSNGVDCGVDLARSTITSFFKNHACDNHGIHLRNDVHGIDVYEGEATHVSLDAHPHVLSDFEQFRANLGDADRFYKLNAVTRVGAELINDSMFPMSNDARFIILISAIEALCEQEPQSAMTIKFIDMMAAAASGSVDGNKEAKRVVVDGLRRLKRESVQQACQRKITQHLGEDSAKLFKQLYNLRSRYVHTGAGRGKFFDPANQAMKMAKALLFAEIEQLNIKRDQ